MDELRITAVQTSLVWEDRKANLEHIGAHINSITEPTDLVVLPEMFTTGFSMEPERIAEPFHTRNMETLNTMREWAKKLDAVITGSVSVEDGGRYYNRLLWVRPDGSFSQYDKRHTFTFAGEHKHYKNGESVLIEDWRGWKICPLICYDLRFPVWSRNQLSAGIPMYDLLIYVACWPNVRREAWKKLLLARSIENQCYTIGVNLTGEDGNGHGYSGDSSVINPKGEYMRELTPDKEETATVTITRKELKEFREIFPVLYDADMFRIL